MEGGGRKRGGTSGASTGGKGARESESFQTGVGSKSKPCTKIFSTAGCPFGEGCHFLHHFPGGHQAVAKMSNLGGPTFAHPPGRMPIGSAVPDGPPTPTVKTRLCNKYNIAEGCKWGDKCHFAHGERELGKHTFIDSSIPPHMGPWPTSHFAPPAMPNPGMVTPASFGASATAKISVDGSLTGAIIGRGGINTKQISRATGAKLAIRDHESDDSLKNIELEGTFDQIKNASAMVTDLIVSISGNNAPPPAKNPAAVSHRGGGPGGNFKTKLCENFTKGSCTFGDRCHFAHGENELRKSGAAASSISMTSARGQEGNDDGARNRSRMRIKYSRDFLLAVGGSEACRRGKPLPADMRASMLIMAGMQLWSMDPTTATADQLQAKTSTETGDEEARGGDGTAAGSTDGAPEPDALQIGVRSKSKACTGFFSTAGCRSGENCLFVHNITVDYQTVADVRVLGSPTTPAHPPRSIPTGPPVPDGPPTPTVQAAPCNSAHTERELDKPRSMDNSSPLID